MKAITRTIWILSFVSLFTDLASEMLYPVMPIYLKTIGFTAFSIGVLEGLAEAVSSISKGYFGKLSDNTGIRAPFVKTGYALSAVSKPLLAVFTGVYSIFFLRTADRLGKGLRTGARDAILADESAHSDRGKVFGFHRSMDTLGAAIGPAFALIYLYLNPGIYKPLFLFSFIPGIVAVSLTMMVTDSSRKGSDKTIIRRKVKLNFTNLNYWRMSTAAYRKLVAGLLFFALFNSSDMFLILKLKESGIGDITVIAIYIFYNAVYALSAFPLGMLADKLGLKKMFLTGIALFAIVYLGMAFGHSFVIYGLLFLLYGLYYGCTEGIAKAWITLLCNANEKATAIGVFSGLQGIAAFMASAFAGFMWYSYGFRVAFVITSAAAVVVFFYLLLNTSAIAGMQANRKES